MTDENDGHYECPAGWLQHTSQGSHTYDNHTIRQDRRAGASPLAVAPAGS